MVELVAIRLGRTVLRIELLREEFKNNNLFQALGKADRNGVDV